MILGIILLYVYLPLTSQYYSADVSIYELFHGDLTNLESFFLLTNKSEADAKPDSPEKNENKSSIYELLLKLEKDNLIPRVDTIEGEDVKNIEESVKSLRRQRESRTWESIRYTYDIDDYNVYYYREGIAITESIKKSMLVMLNLQFLIHTRVKVKEALAMRYSVKRDKRYRLGYLFNRMRKLGVEQRKLATAGEENRIETRDLHSLYTMMRMYERVVRYDVDLRDTAALIKSVYGEKAMIDKLY